MISIHAPLTGSDSMSAISHSTEENFNPRSPYGERLQKGYITIRYVTFQSTLPLRGATRPPKGGLILI